MDERVNKNVPEMPRTVEGLLAQRKNPGTQSLNDSIDRLHLKLWAASPLYQRLLDAVYDEDAIEGSLSADNILCAQMIRKQAEDDDDKYVGSKKLATIVKSLTVVTRRYRQSRAERRAMVNGEIISPAGPSDKE